MLLAASSAELFKKEATQYSPLLQAQAPGARATAARVLHEVYGARMLPWLIGGKAAGLQLPFRPACLNGGLGGRRWGRTVRVLHEAYGARMLPWLIGSADEGLGLWQQRVAPCRGAAAPACFASCRRSAATPRPPPSLGAAAVNGLTKSALEAIRAAMALEELLLEECSGESGGGQAPAPWGTVERLSPLLYTWAQASTEQGRRVGGWVGGVWVEGWPAGWVHAWRRWACAARRCSTLWACVRVGGCLSQADVCSSAGGVLAGRQLLCFSPALLRCPRPLFVPVCRARSACWAAGWTASSGQRTGPACPSSARTARGGCRCAAWAGGVAAAPKQTRKASAASAGAGCSVLGGRGGVGGLIHPPAAPPLPPSPLSQVCG